MLLPSITGKLLPRVPAFAIIPRKLTTSRKCKRGEIVQGDEGPVGGVAQVVCHGVIVVVGHQEEGQEEKGEKQGEVEGEVEKLRDNRTSWMVWRWSERQVNGLEPSGM